MIRSGLSGLRLSAAMTGLAIALLALPSPDSSYADIGPFTWRIDNITATSYTAGTATDITMALSANDDFEEQDMESMRVAWPDGMVPNAGSSEYCELAMNVSSEYYCSNPSAVKTGTQILTTKVEVLPGVIVPVVINSSSYQEKPQPGEVARTVSIPDDNPTSVSYSSIVLREDGSGIDMVSSGIPNQIEIPGFPGMKQLHVSGLQTTISGAASGSITVPAICDPVSFGATFTSYGDDGIANSGDEETRSDTEPFPISNCEAVPYNPSVNLSLSSYIAGSTSNLVTSTGSNVGDALTKEMRIALPAGFGMAPSGVRACTSAEVAAASCPSTSQLGTISVSSALSPTPMQGTINQTEPQGDAVGIKVFLSSDVGSIQISGTLKQTAEGGVEMAFTDFPPLGGMGTVEINMNSASGGSLQNPYSCANYNATSTYISHNNRQVGSAHPLQIVGCQDQAVDTDLSVKLWKPVNNRYTDLRLKVTQSPRQPVDRVAFYLPKDIKISYRKHSKKTPLAYVELWNDRKVKRARLYPYATKKYKRSVKLRAKNSQLKALRVKITKTKGKKTKVELHSIPQDDSLAEASIRLFGKRTRLVRTFKKCVKSRKPKFKVKVRSADGDTAKASSKHKVKCLRRTSSKKRIK